MSGKKFATDCGGKEEAADDEQEEKEDEVTPVMEPHIVGDAELSSTRCKGKPLTGWKGLGKKVSAPRFLSFLSRASARRDPSKKIHVARPTFVASWPLL